MHLKEKEQIYESANSLSWEYQLSAFNSSKKNPLKIKQKGNDETA